jgi:chorismate mutase
VQELAEALDGKGMNVFIKNPINPDVDLWSGAVERFLKTDAKVGMIHRGFSLYGNDSFRNPPLWNIPLEMMRRFPELPMICDPSHICGNRSGLHAVAQTAIDLGMKGLIIESHIHPDQAWSDAKQQITPNALQDLLDKLVWRASVQVTDTEHPHLKQLREKIDILDDELLQLLSKRMDIAHEIGAYKKNNHITIVQMDRFSEILQKGLEKAQALNLSENFIRSYFDVIHMESIEHQNSVMNDKSHVVHE